MQSLKTLIQRCDEINQRESVERLVESCFLIESSAVFKANYRDFKVSEVTDREVRESGDFLFLRVERLGLSHFEMMRSLQQSLKLSASEIGVAGQKDQIAHVFQYLTVPVTCEKSVEDHSHDQLRLEIVGRLDRRLRVGQLHGNQFEVILRGLPHFDNAILQDAVEEVSESGFDNYFGTQRFGRHWQHQLRHVERALHGEAKTRPKKFEISQFQSALFNGYLDSHRNRFATGPVYGWKSRAKENQQLETESDFLSQLDLDYSSFKRLGKFARGARRRMRALPENLAYRQNEGELKLSFTLEPGTYATVFLKHFLEICVSLQSRRESVGRE